MELVVHLALIAASSTIRMVPKRLSRLVIFRSPFLASKQPLEQGGTMCDEGKRSPSKLKLMGCALAMVFMAAGLGISSARAEDGPGPEPGVLQGAYQSPPVTPVKLNVDLATLPRAEPGPFVPGRPADDDQGEENPEVGTPGAAAVDGGVLRVTAQIGKAA
ncbi:MAG: hypothetical protein WAQ33_05765, partial [Gaiellaceae bacterium]